MSEQLTKPAAEPQCKNCMHRHVCMYREIYEDMFKAINYARIETYTGGQMIDISELSKTYPFLNPIELDCEYEDNFMHYTRNA